MCYSPLHHWQLQFCLKLLIPKLKRFVFKVLIKSIKHFYYFLYISAASVANISKTKMKILHLQLKLFKTHHNSFNNTLGYKQKSYLQNAAMHLKHSNCPCVCEQYGSIYKMKQNAKSLCFHWIAKSAEVPVWWFRNNFPGGKGVNWGWWGLAYCYVMHSWACKLWLQNSVIETSDLDCKLGGGGGEMLQSDWANYLVINYMHGKNLLG